MDCDSARAKIALGGARERGWQAGLFPVFPLNFLFFFKYSFVNSVVTISSPVIGQNKVDR